MVHTGAKCCKGSPEKSYSLERRTVTHIYTIIRSNVVSPIGYTKQITWEPCRWKATWQCEALGRMWHYSWFLLDGNKVCKGNREWLSRPECVTSVTLRGPFVMLRSLPMHMCCRRDWLARRRNWNSIHPRATRRTYEPERCNHFISVALLCKNKIKKLMVSRCPPHAHGLLH